MRWRTLYLETAAWEMEMPSFASSPCNTAQLHVRGKRTRLELRGAAKRLLCFLPPSLIRQAKAQGEQLLEALGGRTSLQERHQQEEGCRHSWPASLCGLCLERHDTPPAPTHSIGENRLTRRRPLTCALWKPPGSLLALEASSGSLWKRWKRGTHLVKPSNLAGGSTLGIDGYEILDCLR